MKKLFFISALFISTFLFQKHADAQLLTLDTIYGVPNNVIISQLETLTVVISKAGGVTFAGDLTIFFHTLNDSGPADTLVHYDQYTINSTVDTITIEYLFN